MLMSRSAAERQRSAFTNFGFKRRYYRIVGQTI